MILHVPSAIIGFWACFFAVGLPCAIKRWAFWRRAEAPLRAVVMQALDGLFLWPAWLGRWFV